MFKANLFRALQVTEKIKTNRRYTLLNYVENSALSDKTGTTFEAI